MNKPSKIKQSLFLTQINLSNQQQKTNNFSSYLKKQKMNPFSPSDSYLSQKSSGIHSQGIVTESHNRKRSICQQEIISQNYKQEFEDDQLYNEESSIPLCMKEYYIQQKEMNRLGSKQQITSTQNQSISEYSESQNQQKSKIKLISYEMPMIDKETAYYQSTIEERNKIISLELQNEKIKNLHFQKMLSILIDQDTLQRQKLSNLSQFYREKYQKFFEIQQENRRLKLRNQELEKQVQHYKGLIYIANHNYELIENKLEEAKSQVALLQIQKEDRQKDFHQKLGNLKQVMKSLMTNLKMNENHPISEINQQSNCLQVKDAFNSQGLYSFGDHDLNLRQRKNKNRNEKQQVFNSVQNKGKPTKMVNTQRTQSIKQGTMGKKIQEKQNLEMSQRMDEFFDSNKNYSSSKAATFTKIKSPKNMTVEENYRKLFMKTLVTSSSLKPKNT